MSNWTDNGKRQLSNLAVGWVVLLRAIFRDVPNTLWPVVSTQLPE